MTEITPFLLSMLSQPGLSGFEEPVREIISEKWRSLVDELSVSPLGSLHGLRKSSKPGKRPSLMIATHMDAIGLMVKDVKNAMISVTKIGGIDPRILPGQLVTVHGLKDIPGILQVIPNRLLSEKSSGKAPEFKTMFVDTGFSQKELEKIIQPGNLISFAQPPIEMEGGYISGHSLDNRVSVAALTICLEELKNFNLDWNLIAVATVQEETGLMGAMTSTYDLHPDFGIAVDVTFAKSPGADDHRTFPLGKGPTIGVGANIHPWLRKKFTDLAEEMDMPYSIETMPSNSGTDGMMIQVAREGVPVEVIGIPLRYMHTPYELVSMKDVYRTGRLLARFITQMNEDTYKSFVEENAS